MKHRSLLMIPGPIEFDPAVLSALGAPTTSHLDPAFIAAFGQALERMRSLFRSQQGQPFVVAGSGSLAMDLAGANLGEPGDRALIVNTGYFGDRFGDLLQRYGVEVTHVRAPVGGAPSLSAVEEALQAASYQLLVITHVDTSTGVLAPVRDLAALGQRYGALVIVDGVCSVAGEELDMDGWGVDLALTASQKAVSVPPGLALLVAGPRALQKFQARHTPVPNYYADWANWLPVMQAYEQRKPSYFGTPPVNLIWALNTSLEQILAEGLETRLARHVRLSQACKAGIEALGLSQVPLDPGLAAHTMTAPYFPPGVEGPAFLPAASAAGVTLAGGLHAKIRARYFRIGHMGGHTPGDILATLGAIETALHAAGYQFESGRGTAAAQQALA